MLWKTYRDQLAILLVVLFVGFLGFTAINYPQVAAGLLFVVAGAFITQLDRVVQFYFRKSGPTEQPKPDEPPA
jgi:hypothetical protein